MLVTRTVDRMPPPDLAERQTVLDGDITLHAFRKAFDRLDCLHAVEARRSPVAASAGAALRVVFWNAERLKYPEASAALLDACKADILLLCEVDVGMARTGNRHTVADLAERLGTGWIFGVEFVELGLGDLREQAAHAGEINCAGLHGGAILSRLDLMRPALVRLETSGRWFDGAYHERRVGGRMALMAEIELAGTPVLVVAAHYESHTDPADRLTQTATLLDAIDAHAPDRPVLIGGDFNTATFGRQEKHDPAVVGPALAEDPTRLVAPMAYEPMFELLDARGYDYSRCNLIAPTQRMRPDGTPKPPFGKIDWLFSRGLACSDPEVVPAVGPEGAAISDHEALAITIRLG